MRFPKEPKQSFGPLIFYVKMSDKNNNDKEKNAKNSTLTISSNIWNITSTEKAQIISQTASSSFCKVVSGTFKIIAGRSVGQILKHISTCS